jgi:hypothetical protein
MFERRYHILQSVTLKGFLFTSRIFHNRRKATMRRLVSGLALLVLVSMRLAAGTGDGFSLETWPYGADIDESVFESSAGAVTLHLNNGSSSAADAAENGSDSKPLNTFAYTFDRAVSLLKEGNHVRILIHPGTYQPRQECRIRAGSDENLKMNLLVFEGAEAGAVTLKPGTGYDGNLLDIWGKSNLVIRNLVFDGFSEVMSSNSWAAWNKVGYYDHNWLIEDNVFRNMTKKSFTAVLVYDFSILRCTFENNHSHYGHIGGEGRVVGCRFSNSAAKGVTSAVRNVYYKDCRFDGSGNFAYRNDHVAENLIFDSCSFSENSKAAMFETAIGPVRFFDCRFERNTLGVVLSSAHNFSFDRCAFVENDSCLSMYPRERSHNANKRGGDNPANNLDEGKWRIFSDVDLSPLYDTLNWKPLNENKNIRITNCRFESSQPGAMFIYQNRYRRNSAYKRLLAQELICYNNSYFSSSNQSVFDGNENSRPVDFATWKTLSERDNFEAGSVWSTDVSTSFTEKKQPAAFSAGSSSHRTIKEGSFRFEVEQQPFASSRPVFLRQNHYPGADTVHILDAELIGTYGDWIDYTITVPRTATYYITVNYPMGSGGFEYLGYVQLLVDDEPAGHYFDQCAIDRGSMRITHARRKLTAGDHTFRFRPVWRNGYHSGSYNIGIDYIELSETIELLPARAGEVANTIHAAYYKGVWETIPDFSGLEQVSESTQDHFPLSLYAGDRLIEERYAVPFADVTDGARDFALVLEGTIQTEADVYEFSTTVNDGANLYIDDQLVVENDGIHDGEKNEPWKKNGYVGLAAGMHHIRMEYFNKGGKGKYLDVAWKPLHLVAGPATALARPGGHAGSPNPIAVTNSAGRWYVRFPGQGQWDLQVFGLDGRLLSRQQGSHAATVNLSTGTLMAESMKVLRARQGTLQTVRKIR